MASLLSFYLSKAAEKIIRKNPKIKRKNIDAELSSSSSSYPSSVRNYYFLIYISLQTIPTIKRCKYCIKKYNINV